MRRGVWDPDEGNDPGLPESHSAVHITSTMKVLHPATRFVIGVGFFTGATATMFTWDWRYFAASWALALCGLITGPWRDPREQVRIEPEPLKPNEEGNPW